MKRTLITLGLVLVVLGQTGCTACKKLFGTDRRCETPPPQYYNAPPMTTAGPVNYAPAPGTCTTPK